MHLGAQTESDKLLATVQLFDLEGVQEMALSPGAPILATSSSYAFVLPPKLCSVSYTLSPVRAGPML